METGERCPGGISKSPARRHRRLDELGSELPLTAPRELPTGTQEWIWP